MKCNMGTIDRYIRATMGIAFAVYAAMTLNPILAIPILIVTYTVVTRWCLLYHFLGINTGCHLKDDHTAKGGRNNLIEGLSISLVFLLLLFIIYLIARYLNI